MALDAAGTWLDKTRAFIQAACRKAHFHGHIALIELVLKYQLQEVKHRFKEVGKVKNAYSCSLCHVLCQRTY